MRSAEQRMLNAVQRPEAYREVVLGSAGARIVLSVWDGTTGMPVVLFLPGTMTHPLFYEEFLDAVNRAALLMHWPWPATDVQLKTMSEEMRAVTFSPAP